MYVMRFDNSNPPFNLEIRFVPYGFSSIQIIRKTCRSCSIRDQIVKKEKAFRFGFQILFSLIFRPLLNLFDKILLLYPSDYFIISLGSSDIILSNKFQKSTKK
uniref:Uncharacterized protein n=1 Tax=Cacopsylla melanoneura TaxID=428564 RepID=A0A8D8XDQ5_9HEMI